MIIVAGTLTVPPEHHDALTQAALALTAPTRRETGCEEFEFWADLHRRGRFHVFEVWADAGGYAAHRSTTHLQAFRAALARLQAQVALQRYEAQPLR